MSGNSVFIDSSGEVNNTPINVLSIVITATSANAVLVLEDTQTGSKKLDLRVADSGASQKFSFEHAAIYFTGGITVTTVTNAVATIVTKNKGQ